MLSSTLLYSTLLFPQGRETLLRMMLSKTGAATLYLCMSRYVEYNVYVEHYSTPHLCVLYSNVRAYIHVYGSADCIGLHLRTRQECICRVESIESREVLKHKHTYIYM